MGNRKSLAKTFIKYSVLELLFSLILMFIYLVSIRYMIFSGILYPANHAEKYIETIKIQSEDPKWTYRNIPYYYEYQILENNIKTGNIDKKYSNFVDLARKMVTL